MRKLLSPLLAATAFLTLVPTGAHALPPQCAQICDYSACNTRCTQGILVTTCADWGICGGALDEDADSITSVSEDLSQEPYASSLVCSAAE
jgi:hypothetical protein